MQHLAGYLAGFLTGAAATITIVEIKRQRYAQEQADHRARMDEEAEKKRENWEAAKRRTALWAGGTRTRCGTVV
jgi:hypothetical protein